MYHLLFCVAQGLVEHPLESVCQPLDLVLDIKLLAQSIAWILGVCCYVSIRGSVTSVISTVAPLSNNTRQACLQITYG